MEGIWRLSETRVGIELLGQLKISGSIYSHKVPYLQGLVNSIFLKEIQCV